MTTLRSFIAGGALLGLSSIASAQSIESVTMTSDPADLVFTLRADKPLSAPSVRSYEGAVRVRFPDADAPQSIQVPGDGAAVKQVDLRSGSHDSAVLRLDLGDSVKLSAEDVRIESRKHIVVVRIARDLLPPLREARSAESPKKAEAPLAQASAAPVTKPEKSVDAAPLLAKKTALPVSKKQPLSTTMAGGASSSPMPMLLAVSALLALAYGVLRLVLRKQAATPRAAAPIDIVAQKRIGARHQLVIVRAFGREHLLSIQGGTTTPIATSDELDESFGQTLATASRMEPAAELVQGVAITRRTSEAPREKKDDSASGADLIRVALAQRLNAASKKSNAAESAAETGRGNKDEKALSQAVAGLVRLRREAQL